MGKGIFDHLLALQGMQGFELEVPGEGRYALQEGQNLLDMHRLTPVVRNVSSSSAKLETILNGNEKV